jgi:hypothetical protein
MHFLYELEEEYFTSTARHLRRIGVKTPICGTNWQGGGFTTRIHLLDQSKLDYLDRHGYWDHPQGEGNTKWRIKTCRFHNLPMVRAIVVGPDEQQENNVGNLVLAKAWQRIFGMPMTLTEWNTCLPNEYSLEGTGLMAAYGMLQGWEAPMQFGYFSTDWREELGPGSFDMLGNPPQLLQFPAVATMWHRHDVQEGPVAAEVVYTPETVFEPREDHKPLPWPAAWVGKVGYRFVDREGEPETREIGEHWDPEALTARSLTGQLCWDARRGLVTIDTPRTQGAIGFLAAGPVELSAVTMDLSTPFGAVYVTTLRDELPIGESPRLLVTAVGPARNTGMRYEETDEVARQHGTHLYRLADPGEAPILLRAIAGTVRIRTERADRLQGWVLDLNGRRRCTTELDTEDGTVVLQLAAEHRTVYYELAVE